MRFLKNEFVPYLTENKIKEIYMLGDLFDNRNHINVKIKNAVFDLFENELAPFKITILAGNHDIYYTTTSKINSIKWLSKFENVTILDSGASLKNNMCLVPWVIDQPKFEKALCKVKDDVNICMGHFDIVGFNMNKTYVSKVGMVDDYFYSNFDLTFSGHYHTRTEQTKRKSKIVYVGSPYQMDRNDIGEERGFTILDTETLEYEHIDNTTSMKFVDVFYPDKLKKKDIENNIVQVNITYDDTYNEEDIQTYLKDVEDMNPSFPPTVKVLSKDTDNKELDFDNVQSANELIKEYINTLEIDNKEEIYSQMADLYEECKGAI